MRILWAGLLLCASSLVAQTAFEGTWKVDVNKTQLPKRPETYLLKDGQFTCSTCHPVLEVKADGKDQPVSGSKYFDSVAVTADQPFTVDLVYKKGGKTVDTEQWTVSPDGGTLTEKSTQRPEGSSQPVNSQITLARVQKGPQGAHAISGTWRPDRMDSVSDSGAMATFHSTGDGMSYSTPTGLSYDAKFDGKDYPIKNDPGNTMVSLRKIDDHTIQETDKRDGKVISVNRLTVSPDGKMMTITTNDHQTGARSTVVAIKQ
jgi:hypothetical protein